MNLWDSQQWDFAFFVFTPFTDESEAVTLLFEIVLDGETVETMSDFILGGSKITVDGDCSHEIKRWLHLERKLWPT